MFYDRTRLLSAESAVAMPGTLVYPLGFEKIGRQMPAYLRCEV